MGKDDKRLNEVIRVQKAPSTFVMMDKSFLENQNLSWKAKGILAYLLSKPDNWKVIVGDVVKHATDGKSAVYNGLAELSRLGHYKKVPIRNDKGTFDHWESTVYELPKATNPTNTPSRPLLENSEVGNPKMDSPEMDKPCLENQERNNNYISDNYKISNNNQSSQVMSAAPDGQDRPDGQHDIARKIEIYTVIVKESIRYDDLEQSRPYDMQLVDEFIAIILDTVLTEGKTVRIGSEDKPRALVQSQLLKLTYEDMDHAIDQFKGVTERITKKKQYILTMLYNCKMERDSHYTNAYISGRSQDHE